ncbi:MAG: FecR family protein [Armatimonadota bacterium]
MNKKTVLTILSILIITSVVVSTAFAASSAWKLVVRLKGDVESQKQGTDTWDKIWQSRMLKDGDKARTGDDSYGKIELSDGSITLIGSNTTVEMSQYNVTDNERISKMKLDKGMIRVFVTKFLTGKSTFEITTPNAVLAARGTEFYAEYGVPGAQVPTDTNLAVFSDAVLVTSATERYLIEQGQTASIDAKGTITINPATFTFPKGGPITPEVDDSALTHPGQSLDTSTELHPVMPPPLFNPSNPTNAPAHRGY